MTPFEPGDYVGVILSQVGIRCPILRVGRTRSNFWTLVWPHGETGWISYDEKCWAKYSHEEFVAPHGGTCGCWICNGGLVSLALVSE